MEVARPICAFCTRNARTVDTPLVKVRVERSTPYRGSDRRLWLRVWCHGQVETLVLAEETTEDGLVALEVFRG